MTRKEITQAYKELKPRFGIFQIRNTVNNKIFVEASINLDKIWNRHVAQLNFGSHPSPELQKDWAIHGPQSFVFEELAELEEKEEVSPRDRQKDLKTLEQMYLEELQPYDEQGYNRKPKS